MCLTNACLQLSWVLVGFIFNKVLRDRFRGWWMQYNYITSAALDVGLAIAAIVIFFCVQLPGAAMPDYWGTTIISTTADGSGGNVRKVVADGETFGPSVSLFLGSHALELGAGRESRHSSACPKGAPNSKSALCFQIFTVLIGVYSPGSGNDFDIRVVIFWAYCETSSRRHIYLAVNIIFQLYFMMESLAVLH